MHFEVASGMFGRNLLEVAINTRNMESRSRVENTTCIAIFGISGGRSVLASFAISSMREMPLRLPPGRSMESKPWPKSAFALETYIPVGSSRVASRGMPVPFSVDNPTLIFRDERYKPAVRSQSPVAVVGLAKQKQLTGLPASGNPFILSRACFASSCFLNLYDRANSQTSGNAAPHLDDTGAYWTNA